MMDGVTYLTGNIEMFLDIGEFVHSWLPLLLAIVHDIPYLLHSFLSLSITRSSYCSQSFNFRLRMCLRVSDSNGHHERLVYKGSE